MLGHDLPLVEREAGNFLLPAHPGLIVKASYWPWPERDLAGNAIELFMRVLGLSLHESMRQTYDRLRLTGVSALE